LALGTCEREAEHVYCACESHVEGGTRDDVARNRTLLCRSKEKSCHWVISEDDDNEGDHESPDGWVRLASHHSAVLWKNQTILLARVRMTSIRRNKRTHI